MMRLTDLSVENGLALALEGEELSLDDVVSFAQFLAENGNEEAAAALGDFSAAVENMG